MESIDSGGIDTSLSEVAASIEETLVSHRKEIEQPVPPMLQELSSEEPTLEEEAALLEISSRRAEVEAALVTTLVGSTTDMEDMNTFISSLSNHGFAVELARVQDAIRTIIMETAYRSEQEQNALSSKPGSWSEREAIRMFEQMRPQLREEDSRNCCWTTRKSCSSTNGV